MQDFNGKIIKIILNATSGWVTMSGPFLKFENDFIVIKNSFSNKIEYISKYYIKSIELISDVSPDNLVEMELDSYEK